MKTLREVADELCPYRLEDYDPAIDDMSDELIRMGWIDGFITGAQWREDNPVAADSASDPESDSIELCGLLWDTENLAIGGFVVNFGDMDIFDLSDCFGDSYQMWVIGNIHDNADLIK